MGATHETKKTLNASIGNLATAAPPEPTVACVMLVNGRPEMTKRAVQSFRSQTYERKRLLILDTGGPGPFFDGSGIVHACRSNWNGFTIGHLRNEANYLANAYGECDIIAHFDSDDLSGPNRLAEQVALLQASGADCVGYNQAVFWDERQQSWPMPQRSEAWVYTSVVPKGILGASMCYLRTSWERKPFLDRRTGEDDRWLSGMKVCGVSAMEYRIIEDPPGVVRNIWEPRLIAGVHGGNTSKVNPCEGPREWRRAPDLDAYCREKMRLENL